MLAVAALSARMLAELARASGEQVVALDMFGDADTRAAAQNWQPIGNALRIEEGMLLAAFDALAADGRVRGWIAGSGFEAQGVLLERAAERLPLIGTAPDDMRRVCDPRHFFGTLRELDLAHPPVRFDPPADRSGWLVKDAASCGGWGVFRTGSQEHVQGHYWQRARKARAMSVTLLANGHDAVVLGINEQITQAIGPRPFVFAGVLGPVPASALLTQRVRTAARALAERYRLRGLASLDFLLEDDEAEPEWLEINARPPASAELYAAADPLRLHLRACRDGTLPRALPVNDAVHGQQIVFADRALQVSAEQADRIARWPQAHDRPLPGTRIEAGAPLCSLGASGRRADEVRRKLAEGRDRLLAAMHGAVEAAA